MISGFINITLVGSKHVTIFIGRRNGYHVLQQRRLHVFILFEHLMVRPLFVLLQLVRGQVFVVEPSTFAPHMLCWVKRLGGITGSTFLFLGTKFYCTVHSASNVCSYVEYRYQW